MTDQDTSEARVIEPLAKFHARVLYNGRIAIPENTRIRYGFGKGDWVEILIRKVEINGGPVLGRGHFFARITNKGLITIPKGLRDELGILEKDIVEIILLDVIKVGAILQKKGVNMSKLIKDGYEILDENTERILLFKN
jgi:AbrB family looped-hinge helix DNA binding protein